MAARRVVCFSAYSQNLRAAAFVRFLRELGFEVIRPTPHGAPGTVQELALTLIPYCWQALTCRADLVLGCKPHLNVTLPLFICRLRGIPTWLDVDDLDHAYRDNWLSRVVEILERPWPRWFRIVSYHNELLQDYLVKHLHCEPSRLLRIEQGVDCALAGQAVTTSTLIDRYDLREKRVAVYVAHLNLASDLDVVLTAWQKVGETVPASLLVVVGGGPLQAHYENRARELGVAHRVRFAGEVPHTEVPAFLALADVALLYFAPRKVNAYRCSLKLREYCAAGCKIVCNDFGELKQYAHLTYQSGSEAAEFGTRIARVLQGEHDDRELTAQRFAVEHLDWRPIMAAATTEIQQCLGWNNPSH